MLNVKGDGRLEAKPLLARIVATPCRVKMQLLVDTPDCDWQDDCPTLGIDVGIKSQVTLSDGAQYPKRKRALSRLKRLQRRVARVVKGSNGRHKKRLALAREHQRIQERERGGWCLRSRRSFTLRTCACRIW